MRKKLFSVIGLVVGFFFREMEIDEVRVFDEREMALRIETV